ncbi:MAG: hypothetical protein ACK4SZ_03270 [Allosphingosinicella sp.]|uniref:hypothetical protein n=1 Tax=Allosphingosinicella sp. TaxID=2823234 RepID=UPI00392A42B8
MAEEVESKRKQGPVTVLTLLFGLLIGLSGPGAQLQTDPGQTRLGNGEIARTASGLRLSSRSSNDNPDDSKLALVPPAPLVVTELVLGRPATTTAPAAANAAALAPHVHYYARAPPAA